MSTRCPTCFEPVEQCSGDHPTVDRSNIVPLITVLHRQPMMSFGAALSALKQDYNIARKAWKSSGKYLTILECLELVQIFEVWSNDRTIWIPTQSDILAQDWVVIADEYR